MNPARILLSTAAGFVAMFLVNYLWHGQIFHRFWLPYLPASGVPDVSLHALGDLAAALLMAITYALARGEGSPVAVGLRFGLVLGLLATLPATLHDRAVGMGGAAIVAVNAGSGLVAGAVGGVVIALIQGRGAGAPAT